LDQHRKHFASKYFLHSLMLTHSERTRYTHFHSPKAASAERIYPKKNAQIPPFHPFENERLKALHALEILNTEAEACYDELVEVAASICDAPIALVSLIDSKQSWGTIASFSLQLA
jgi:hypothetical protein